MLDWGGSHAQIQCCSVMDAVLLACGLRLPMQRRWRPWRDDYECFHVKEESNQALESYGEAGEVEDCGRYRV